MIGASTSVADRRRRSGQLRPSHPPGEGPESTGRPGPHGLWELAVYRGDLDEYRALALALIWLVTVTVVGAAQFHRLASPQAGR